jgi:hypothetical protein
MWMSADAPSVKSPSDAMVPKGTWGTVLDTAGDLIRVEFDDHRMGWVIKQILKPFAVTGEDPKRTAPRHRPTPAAVAPEPTPRVKESAPDGQIAAFSRPTPIWFTGGRLPKPGTDIVGMTIAAGERLPVLEQRENYTRVRLDDGRTGWVGTGWVVVTGQTPVPPSEPEPDARPAEAPSAIVTVRDTPVWLTDRPPAQTRDEPGLMVPGGQSIEVLGSQAGFVRIRLPDGMVGWTTRAALADRLGRTAITPTAPPAERRREVRRPKPVETTPQTPASRPAPVAPSAPVPRPIPPPQPSGPTRSERIRARLGEIGEAIGSDLAVHGFSYLGLVLTFAGVFGYMFFSFQDLEDQYQPIVEAAIPIVFFGWAWYLRRRKASIVAGVLELLGGLILPIIIYAALVDSASIPPDLEGGPLVVGMIVVAVLTAAGYAWWSGRHPVSRLGYLVGPALWLGGLAAGFVFKTDEALQGPAITRLVPAQGATGAIAIALTLIAFHFWFKGRLRRPTMIAALPAVAIAYALAVGMEAAVGWTNGSPIVVAGAATYVSISLLALHFERIQELRIIQPLAIAAIIAPLVPTFGAGWAGTLAFGAYLAWTEWTLHVDGSAGMGTWIALGGAALGLGAAFTEPWGAVVSVAAVSMWAHARRISGSRIPGSRVALIGIAFVGPFVFGETLLEAINHEAAWFTLATVALVATGAVRATRSDDRFWWLWLPSVVAASGIGPAIEWFSGTIDQAGLVLAALSMSTIAIAATPVWRALRVWLAAAGIVTTTLVALDAAGATWDQAWLTWAGLGLAGTAAAAAWHRHEAGHLALIGHGIGITAAIGALGSDVGAITLTFMTVGLISSTVVDELGGESAGSLLASAILTMFPSETPRLVRWIRSVPAFLAVAVTPFATVDLLQEWPAFADHRSWSGIALAGLAIVYAAATRLLRTERPVRRLLAIGAMAQSAIAIAVAAPVAWPSIIASAASLGIVFILAGDLREVAFTWFAWAMSGVLVTLLAKQAGVPSDWLHVVVVSWGGALLLGGLVADQVRHGPRQPGDGVRDPEFHAPVAIGALAFPLGLGPVLNEAPGVYGWWVLGVGVTYLLVARLLRTGAASLPGWALIALGTSVLVQPDPFEPAWILPTVSTGLVAIGWTMDVRQSDAARSDPWLRWDLPPLLVTIIIGVVAMSRSFAIDSVPETWTGFGLIAIAVGVWKRSPWWRDAGNAAVIVGATAFGVGPGALAMVATAARMSVEARYATAAERAIRIGLTPIATGIAWLQIIAWTEWTTPDAAAISAVVFGALTLITGLTRRYERLSTNWVIAWGALAVTGTAAAAIAAATTDITSPWPAIGMLTFAAGLAVTGPIAGIGLELPTAAATGIAWLQIIAWTEWTTPEVLTATSLGVGAIVLAAVITARLGRLSAEWVAAWSIVGTMALVFAWMAQLGEGNRPTDLWPAIGLLLVAIAAQAAVPVLGRGVGFVTPGVVPLVWLAGGAGLDWTPLQASAASSATFAAMAVGVVLVASRLPPSEPDDEPPSPLDVARTWAVMTAIVVAGAVMAAGSPSLRSAAWVVGGTALVTMSLAAIRGSTVLQWPRLDDAAGLVLLAGLSVVSIGLDPSGDLLGWMSIGLTVVAATTLLVVSHGARTRWTIPTISFGLAAVAIAAGSGIIQWPETAVLTGAALAAAAHVTASGIALTSPTTLAVGPLLAMAAWLIGLQDADVSGYLWYTMPIGILLLAEVEVARWAHRSGRLSVDRQAFAIGDWIGMGVLAGSPLAHMIAEGVGSTLLAFGAAAGILVWSLVTRVRRRFIASLILGGVTAVMSVAVAATGGAPASAGFWIMLVAVGVSALLTVGIIDGYRSRSGAVMRRFTEMMEDWE